MSKPRLPDDWTLEEFQGQLDGYAYARYSDGYETIEVHPVDRVDPLQKDYHQVHILDSGSVVPKRVIGSPEESPRAVEACNIARRLIIEKSHDGLFD